MATLKYTIDTHDSTMVNWHKHIDPHIFRSCSGINRGLSFRRFFPILLCYHFLIADRKLKSKSGDAILSDFFV